MLEIGVEAPGFSVRDHHGELVDLCDLRGQKVLLWFYLRADTPAERSRVARCATTRTGWRRAIRKPQAMLPTGGACVAKSREAAKRRVDHEISQLRPVRRIQQVRG